MGQTDRQMKSNNQGFMADQEDHLTKVERRLQMMEALTQNHANQMIDTLSTLNENIISLGKSLKFIGIGGFKEYMIRDDTKLTDEEKEVTKGLVEHLDDQNQESMVMEAQRDYKSMKTMQEIKGQTDQQGFSFLYYPFPYWFGYLFLSGLGPIFSYGLLQIALLCLGFYFVAHLYVKTFRFQDPCKTCFS